MLQNDATDWQLAEMLDPYGLMLASSLTHGYERLYSQAADGALIVEETRHTAGVILLIPASFREKEWYRFPPAGTLAAGNAPQAPGGVLQPGAGYNRLLPPGSLDRNESGNTMDTCLDFAYPGMGDLTPAERALLTGRSTQAFLYQFYPGGKPFLNTEWMNRKQGYVPSTRKSRLQKPHWLLPAVSDRYVLCLLDTGCTREDIAS